MSALSDAALERLRRAADTPDLSGTRYTIVRELARGGMGTVYEARDAELERHVALKVITAPEAIPQSVARLRREARTLGQLEHPGIVPVHDIGALPDGRLFYAMKLVRGERLDEVVRRASPTASRAELLRVFCRVCETVAFAHANGVVHRDVKPENVMVGPFGEVLLLDWGLATSRSEHTDQAVAEEKAAPSPMRGSDALDSIRTDHGTVLGTPGWMAPEQARGDVAAIDARTDVYALGALLRWLLAAIGEVPKPLAAVVARAMSDNPPTRYASASSLADEVQSFLEGRPVSAHREKIGERAGRLARRYRVPIGLVLAYIAMRVVMLLVWRH